jgi:hypothetical protein
MARPSTVITTLRMSIKKSIRPITSVARSGECNIKCHYKALWNSSGLKCTEAHPGAVMELSDSLWFSLHLSTSYSSTSFADDSNATAPKPPSCVIDYSVPLSSPQTSARIHYSVQMNSKAWHYSLWMRVEAALCTNLHYLLMY